MVLYIYIYIYMCFILNRETCIQRNLKTSENDSEYWRSFNVTHHSYKLWGYKSQEWTLPRRPIAFMQAGRKKRSFRLGWRLAQHVQQPRSNNWQSTSVWSMDSNVSEEMSTGKMINVEGHRIKHNKTSLSNVVSTFHKQDGDSLCTSLCIEMIQVLPAHRYPLVVTGMSHWHPCKPSESDVSKTPNDTESHFITVSSILYSTAGYM